MRTKLTKAALALTIPALLVATVPAGAAVPSHAVADTHVATGADMTWNNGDRGRHRGWDRGRRGHDRGYDRGYESQGRYDRYERHDRYDQPVYASTRTWRGDDGRYYCRRDDGTTGLLIGGVVGGLIGNEVAGRGDRTLGAIIGAAGGAILGRSIDRSNSRCR